MTRYPNWPHRLNAFIMDRVSAPFEWGSSDCCLFAADAVLAMTGVDLAENFRGYHTAAEAARLTAKHGDVEGLATLALGEPIDPRFAKRGDVVLIETQGRLALAVCLGVDWIGQGERASVSGPMTSAIKAWAV